MEKAIPEDKSDIFTDRPIWKKEVLVRASYGGPPYYACGSYTIISAGFVMLSRDGLCVELSSTNILQANTNLLYSVNYQKFQPQQH